MIVAKDLNRCTINKHDTGWVVFENLTEVSVQKELRDHYPSAGFTRCERAQGDEKHYRFDVLSLLTRGNEAAGMDILSPIWKEFVSELVSPSYIAALSSLAGASPDDVQVSAGFFRFRSDDWVAPHLDRPEKLLTQIFYFNTNWRSAWGGSLNMLRGDDASTSYFELMPLSRYTAAILRNDSSWHMVAPVQSPATEPRLSFQLELWRREKRGT